jgi:hypothetical protein
LDAPDEGAIQSYSIIPAAVWHCSPIPLETDTTDVLVQGLYRVAWALAIAGAMTSKPLKRALRQQHFPAHPAF